MLGKPSLKKHLFSLPMIDMFLVVGFPTHPQIKMNRISERLRSGLICLACEGQMTFTPDIHLKGFIMEGLVFKNKKQVSKLKGKKNNFLVWLRKRLVVLRSSQPFFILTHAFPMLASVFPFFVSPHHLLRPVLLPVTKLFLLLNEIKLRIIGINFNRLERGMIVL